MQLSIYINCLLRDTGCKQTKYLIWGLINIRRGDAEYTEKRRLFEYVLIMLRNKLVWSKCAVLSKEQMFEEFWV